MTISGSVTPPTRAGHVVWHASADEDSWVDAAVASVCGALRAELSLRDETWLLLSGGSTPAPVYRALARQALDWARIVVSLVDERDVDADAAGSNARLIRETMLHDRAAAARFLPLREIAPTLEAAVAASNARWPVREAVGDGGGARPASASIAAAVLGMGDDGHTASLFPGAANLDVALASPEPYAAIDAHGCPGAGLWPRRISLTPAGLAPVRQRLLLIRGAGKRAVFDDALAAGDVRAAPIRCAIDAPGATLQVHWCP